MKQAKCREAENIRGKNLNKEVLENYGEGLWHPSSFSTHKTCTFNIISLVLLSVIFFIFISIS